MRLPVQHRHVELRVVLEAAEPEAGEAEEGLVLVLGGFVWLVIEGECGCFFGWWVCWVGRRGGPLALIGRVPLPTQPTHTNTHTNTHTQAWAAEHAGQMEDDENWDLDEEEQELLDAIRAKKKVGG